jgi:hypothetical protein
MVKPIAVSIAFGLMASTLLVLFVVPCLYVILADFGLSTLKHSEDDLSEEEPATVAPLPEPK